MPSLSTYRKKRDFSRTREPAGAVRKANGTRTSQRLSYVIQKHAARQLHYDFRLELDGVLLSWAVPKGPSLDPEVKRLAQETEPHPLDYSDFEGTIPNGEYGGGAVMVWDRGSWKPEGDAREGYAKGHLSFTLAGEKLKGRWHLIRTKQGKDGKGWLLFKGQDEVADKRRDIMTEAPNSALTGRSIEQIAAAEGASKVSNQNAPQQSAKEVSKKRESTSRPKVRISDRQASNSKRKAVRIPEFEPQLATLSASVPSDDAWLHEVKFDGYRILAKLNQGEVRLITRGQKDWTDRMPKLARALSAVRADSAVLDGELVVLNEAGISDFQLLQNSLDAARGPELLYYAFDLLFLNGQVLTSVPLLERKERLAGLLHNAAGKPLSDTVRFSDHVVGGGPAFLAKACQVGLEGIVSKRSAAPYRGGRGREWLKIKCGSRQEFVIVGYTDPEGSRSHLGALVLGVLREGRLSYAGRVGTGFNEQSLRLLAERLAPLQLQAPPVIDAPRGSETRGVHWVKPILVAEVAFTGFTSEGRLRHPSFKGLREDKPAREVKLEHTVKPEVEMEESPAKPGAKRESVAKPATAAKAKSGAKLESGTKPAAAAQAKPGAKRESVAKPATAAKAKSGAKLESGTKPQPAAASYPLSHPDKVLYPELGITKRELLEYYELVAERMLPHVENRPLTLVRCPEGRKKHCFFQKHPGEGMPLGLRAVAVREADGKAPYAVIDDAQGLFGLVQIGALEIHTWGSRASDYERPDILVFDLDPAPELEFAKVMQSARRVRELFEGAGLESFVKTTGGKGLHVCIPIEPDLRWDKIKDFCGGVAAALVNEAPHLYVATASKAKRKGKIFVDYLRNARGATFIAPYSTRAREGAPIAMPLEWDELRQGFSPARFTLRNARALLKGKASDPFARMAKLKQRLRPDAG